MFAHQVKNPNYLTVFAALLTKWQKTRHVVGTEKENADSFPFPSNDTENMAPCLCVIYRPAHSNRVCGFSSKEGINPVALRGRIS